MRIFITIALLSTTVASIAQTKEVDCRFPDVLLQSVWKHEMGSTKWKHTIDSVINLCPNSARLLGVKAAGYMIRGDFVEGMRYLNQSAKLDPYIFLGSRAWYRINYLHDYNGAIKDLDSLESIAGNSFVYVINVHMHVVKGLAYQEIGDLNKALELYNSAINQQVELKGEKWVGTDDYLYRGILKYRMGDMDGAIDDLSRQIKEYELLADPYYYRGLALAAVGRKDEARVDIQRAKDLMLGEGQNRWESVYVVPDQVYLSDVENALLKLY